MQIMAVPDYKINVWILFKLSFSRMISALMYINGPELFTRWDN
jgi:hypothetical protein